jgi:hypothetical protein
VVYLDEHIVVLLARPTVTWNAGETRRRNGATKQRRELSLKTEKRDRLTEEKPGRSSTDVRQTCAEQLRSLGPGSGQVPVC